MKVHNLKITTVKNKDATDVEEKLVRTDVDKDNVEENKTNLNDKPRDVFEVDSSAKIQDSEAFLELPEVFSWEGRVSGS